MLRRDSLSTPASHSTAHVSTERVKKKPHGKAGEEGRGGERRGEGGRGERRKQNAEIILVYALLALERV